MLGGGNGIWKRRNFHLKGMEYKFRCYVPLGALWVFAVGMSFSLWNMSFEKAEYTPEWCFFPFIHGLKVWLCFVGL